MKVRPRIPPDLKKRLLAAKAELDAFVKDSFEGRILVWDAYSRYPGRKVRVRRACWDWDWREDEEISVDVLVETERLDGKGYLDSNDHYHRTYMDVYSNFSEVK